MNSINHIAIIMDGNGRWGLKKKGIRNYGHKKGLLTVKKILKNCIKKNIKYLTLFTFSTENWKRPNTEINYLFYLLDNFLSKKFSNRLKRKSISFLGLFQFSVENAYKVKNFNLNFNEAFIIFSTDIKPAL